ncbi:MAG: hypothetical protein HQL51_03710 [Magnetococcales bacterium]|nr:hypothetical protein [Magnetococcales bacterium]
MSPDERPGGYLRPAANDGGSLYALQKRFAGAAGPVCGNRDATREALLSILMRGVTLRSGLRSGEGLTDRLGRYVAGLDIRGLSTWVARLESLPGEHPEWQVLFDFLLAEAAAFTPNTGRLPFIARELLPELIQRERDQEHPRIRLWSAGCATGEESYALAMLTLNLLAEQGIAVPDEAGNLTLPPHWSLTIDGADIARKALKTAIDGEYCLSDDGEGSFFLRLPGNLHRFFDHDAGLSPFERDGLRQRLGVRCPVKRRVRNDVRRLVRFRFFNLLGETPPEGEYDLIYCGMVLDYLDREGVKKALGHFHRALHPQGRLVAGVGDGLAVGKLFEARSSGESRHFVPMGKILPLVSPAAAP